jgi:single-stranded-DNA-specific exonuclease
LGTVADVVVLDYNNRIFVSQGLARIRRGKCCAGILALMESAGKDYTAAVASDFGFVIAPRLNASGRLDDISTGIECLLATNGADARRYATMLEEINSERKTIEQDMQSRAMEIVRGIMKRMDSDSEQPGDVGDSGFCLHDPDWHQGITGLVASRVRENTGQPVIAFAPNSDGMLTGSARSIPGLHIKDLLEAVVASSPGLVEKFGGHAMAAGLTIKSGNLEQFKQLFRERVTRHFYEHGSIDTIFTDGELADQEINLGNAEDIRNAAPWGQGFPVPVFEGVFRIADISIVGQLHLKMKLVTEDMARSFDAIAFRAIEPGQALPDLEKIHAVYQLDVNEFRGNRKLQLVVSYFTPVE